MKVKQLEKELSDCDQVTVTTNLTSVSQTVEDLTVPTSNGDVAQLNGLSVEHRQRVRQRHKSESGGNPVA